MPLFNKVTNGIFWRQLNSFCVHFSTTSTVTPLAPIWFLPKGRKLSIPQHKFYCIFEFRASHMAYVYDFLLHFFSYNVFQPSSVFFWKRATKNVSVLRSATSCGAHRQHFYTLIYIVKFRIYFENSTKLDGFLTSFLKYSNLTEYDGLLKIRKIRNSCAF